MADTFVKKILDKIQNVYGLYVNYAHEGYMTSLITQRADLLKMSLGEYSDYVEKSEEELTFLTDEAAINETYFFREEKQFDFLKDNFFPSREQLFVWCTSCSTGEEPLSVYSLAKYCNKNITLYASDIDTQAISFFKKGIYSKHSFRVDGQKYHHVIKHFCTEVAEEDTLLPAYKVDENILNMINIFRHNLVAEADFMFPIQKEILDLIIIRNVFIYFDEKDRNFILKKLAEYLKPGGIILFAMSEIASISGEAVPELKKENLNSVYYFRKLLPGENFQKKPSAREILSQPELRKAIMGESLSSSKNEKFTQVNIENYSESTDYVNKLEVLLDKNQANFETKMETVSKSQVKEASVDFESIVKDYLLLLEKREFEKCQKLLDGISFRADNIEFKYYLTGMFQKENGQLTEAVENFVKAGFSKPHFWPAKYQLGLLHNQMGKIQDMKTVFSDCVKDLLEYTETQSKVYAFLFEDFDSSYFLELCYGYLYKKM